MTKPAETTKSAEQRIVFVALCASGVKTRSLEQLVVGLRLPPEAAVILVLQHREALDESGFRRILEGSDRALTAVVDGEAAEAGGLYLADANVILDIEGGRFRTRASDRGIGHRGTVDSFLVSLARDQESRVVAVAMDGTDGDGTLGFKAVKEADGLTLAEVTEEANGGELAMSDHPAALADALLPVAAIGERIAAFVRHLGEQDGKPRAELGEAQEGAARATIANILRHGTGHDFHGYKTGTFMRRIERRMQVVAVTDLQAYIELLRNRPGEVQELFNDLLIGVTRFFRDPGEFTRLERRVIPKLFEGRGRGDQVRLWVIGCSTGEEAYSLGILLHEHMSTLDEVPQVQIFATDLDGRALAAARVGRYPDSIAADLGPERLARWFVREGNTFCIVKELRELCIFSQHSIVKDAPFSRLDIVSCRNLLIYLDAELQSRIIPLFHFALRPGGTLFLGNSENVSRHNRLFAPIENHSRIFRRVDTAARVFPDFPFSTGVVPAPTTLPMAIAPRVAELALTRRAERLAERHAPAYVIVDEGYNVLHFSGRTGRYIDPVAGAASLNLMQLAHRDLRVDLRAVLARAVSTDAPAQVEGVLLGRNGSGVAVDIVAEAIVGDGGRSRNFVVLFKDSGSARNWDGGDASDPVDHTRHLEAELRSTQNRLQATNEALESANEELKASNEEYQALNEELQSMNEELQTSKEELQSVNEELTTLNGELGQRVRELSRANSDLQNLMESTQIASLFLDNELRVTSFTPAAVELFHLVESDRGRPIGHIKARIGYDELQDDARRVMRTLATVERDIGNENGAGQYMARVLPYRSTDNFIAGVVVTFVEVTALKQAERLLRLQEERFRTLLTGTTTSMYRMSPDWNEMRELDGGGFLLDTVQTNTDWLSTYILPEDQPLVLAAIEEAIRTSTTFALEHRVHRADGGIGWTYSRAVPLLDAKGAVREWFGAASDITERRQAKAVEREPS